MIQIQWLVLGRFKLGDGGLQVAVRVNWSVQLGACLLAGRRSSLILAKNVTKFVSMYLFGVEFVASCRAKCIGGYGVDEGWKMCEFKWPFVSSRSV